MGNNRLTDDHQRMSVFDRLAIFDQDRFDDAGTIRFNFIEQLHGFYDAHGIALGNCLADFNEYFGAR